MSGAPEVLRTDLLELTPAALAALANAGFVKRAQREVAAGQLPQLTLAGDGALTAHYADGSVTRLPAAGTVRDAACSCSASGMCRHRVMLVLAYQAQVTGQMDASAAAPEEGWSPARFDDALLAAQLPASVREQAARLLMDAPVVTVHFWQGRDTPPLAQLPMCSVRFFSRDSLAHARCDCQMGAGCAHVVLAVWAFRQAAANGASGLSASVQLHPSSAAQTVAAVGLTATEQALCTQIDAVLLAIWLDGSAQPLLALAARIEAARAGAQTLGWCWVEDALVELVQLLQAQHARSTRFEPQRLPPLVAELWARLCAARSMAATTQPRVPPGQIVGTGVQGEVALERLRLVSLGAVLWSDERHEGASVLWADADTQSLTVLERHWPRSSPTTAPAIQERRVAGHPLRQLACSQVITRGAVRSANGRIDITASRQHTGLLPLSPRAWDGLAAPLRQPDVAALARHLHNSPPAFVQPRHAASGIAGGTASALHVLQLDAMQVQSSGWDAATQVMHATLVADTATAVMPGSAPVALQLVLPHRAASPGAVDALARALSGQYGRLHAVAGSVQLHDGDVLMQPLALLTDTQAIVLQVAQEPAQPLSLQPAPQAGTSGAALAGQTLELLALCLRQGLRHQDEAGFERLRAQAEQLHLAGFKHAATRLRGVRACLHPSQRHRLLRYLATLTLLLQGLMR